MNWFTKLFSPTEVDEVAEAKATIDDLEHLELLKEDLRKKQLLILKNKEMLKYFAKFHYLEEDSVSLMDGKNGQRLPRTDLTTMFRYPSDMFIEFHENKVFELEQVCLNMSEEINKFKVVKE